MIDVEAINTDEGVSLLTDGNVVPITDYLDDDGNNCVKADAVMAICGTQDTGFYAVTLEDYKPTMTH